MDRGPWTAGHASSGVSQRATSGGRHAARRSSSAAGSESVSDNLTVRRPQELLGARMLEEREQVIVEAGHVQQPARLDVQPKLRPRHRLAELLERAEAAGQGDEAVGQRRHERLALVHRLDDVKRA